MKNNKGITLIALIVTIIVMLILVAVSVTVALQGGLFTTTEDAKRRTQNAVDRELAIDAASGLYGGKTFDQWAAVTGNERTTIDFTIRGLNEQHQQFSATVLSGETWESFITRDYDDDNPDNVLSIVGSLSIVGNLVYFECGDYGGYVTNNR